MSSSRTPRDRPSASGLSASADSFDRWQHHLDTETRSETRSDSAALDLRLPALTVLWHPSPKRVGERVIFGGWAEGAEGKAEIGISRQEPEFEPPGGGRARPLADPRISRRPILVRPCPGGVRLDPNGSRTALAIHGPGGSERRLEAGIEISETELGRGVVLTLAERVALLLHWQEPAVRLPPSFGLVGESSAMVRLRRRIEKVAQLEVPVLLLGESGTGKELVAEAVQKTSPRRQGSFVSLNMAAIPPTLAASELFGAAKGAYSGADQRRPGFFVRADGGTLFLDEIGESPVDVQVLLLRALENGEIQPVGADRASRVDVRVIAATDADLESAVSEGRFKAPLLHRLSSYVLRLPPLRERRDDIGRLFLHFLKQELDSARAGHLLMDPGPHGRPWMPASVVARLASRDWPGNVRQLRNAVRQLVVSNRDEQLASLDPELDFQLSGSARPPLRSGAPVSDVPVSDASGSDGLAERAAASSPVPRRPPKRYRDPSEVSEDELIEALRAHRWQPKPTAEALGISRASIYALMERSSRIRKASELGPKEIEAAREQLAGDLEAMAGALEVSKQGLKMRMGELGLRRTHRQ